MHLPTGALEPTPDTSTRSPIRIYDLDEMCANERRSLCASFACPPFRPNMILRSQYPLNSLLCHFHYAASDSEVSFRIRDQTKCICFMI